MSKINHITRRAISIFSLLIFMLLISTISTLAIGVGTGEIQKRFLNPVKDQYRKFIANLDKSMAPKNPIPSVKPAFKPTTKPVIKNNFEDKQNYHNPPAPAPVPQVQYQYQPPNLDNQDWEQQALEKQAEQRAKFEAEVAQKEVEYNQRITDMKAEADAKWEETKAEHNAKLEEMKKDMGF